MQSVELGNNIPLFDSVPSQASSVQLLQESVLEGSIVTRASLLLRPHQYFV